MAGTFADSAGLLKMCVKRIYEELEATTYLSRLSGYINALDISYKTFYERKLRL
jgi:hypothetical protein